MHWIVLSTLLVAMNSPDTAFLGSLSPSSDVGDFRAEAVYDNATGEPMGARWRHRQSGFVLDLMRIQSIPQVFIWVNSEPPSDRGEPHTCEHLLLGKGRRGRTHASREEMSLAQSSAFTGQLRTCYHMHADTEPTVFFGLLESQLEALVHPDYSDEEIRREVCHLGVVEDPTTGELSLEEKGTVYNEMASTFEQPWTLLFHELSPLLYGEDHVLARSSGGVPAAIREMKPQHLRDFHASAYHLANMGMILALPDEVSFVDALAQTGDILARLEPGAVAGPDPAAIEDRLPAFQPAPEGSIRSVAYPSHNPEAPAQMLLAWPPTRDLEPIETGLLSLFLANLASGETSILYDRFIDSSRRVLNTGASAVFGWADSDRGSTVYLGMSDINAETIERIDEIVAIIREELETIRDWPDGSAELREFNEKALGRVVQSRRSIRRFLNSPPGFGFRSTGSGWLGHLQDLRRLEGFHKALDWGPIFTEIESLLSAEHNAWRQRITAWGLLSTSPFQITALPDATILESESRAREARMDRAAAALVERYGTNPNAAISRFRGEYDAATATIDEVAGSIATPGFLAHPPLTLDDRLNYRELQVAGVPSVQSIFDHMAGSTVGLALRLDGIEPALRHFVTALPALLLDVGVVRDGVPISYDEMTEALRREVLGLNATIDTGSGNDRIELMLRASGTETQETLKAIEWASLGLFNADWREENLSRIRDVIDSNLSALRNTPRGAEEGWVSDVELAWRWQQDTLLLRVYSYAAQTYDLLRLRWLFRADAGAAGLLHELSRVEAERRELYTEILQALDGKAKTNTAAAAWARKAKALPEPARMQLKEALADLEYCISQVPDASLVQDWQQLCKRIALDLERAPAASLADLQRVAAEIHHRAGARLFVVGSEATIGDLEPALAKWVGGLDAQPFLPHARGSKAQIARRLQERGEIGSELPLHLGVVNPSTSSGVVILTAPGGGYGMRDREALLDVLATRLYGGGGAHSLFMQTWGAGLAYSNGLGLRPDEGRITYYAERCPDVAQTLRFVTKTLRASSAQDPALAEYAVAQLFTTSRAAAGYAGRAEAIAADLADGRRPDQIRAYREAVLALRDELSPEDFLAELRRRLPEACGVVLPGLGRSPVPGASYVVIGPENQIDSYEAYLAGTPNPAVVARAHPRDFWIVE